MLTRPQFIQKSLETNLFWMRIMKEHLIFMEASFMCKDVNLFQQSQLLRTTAEQVLAQAIRLANGVIPTEALMAHDLVTANTLPAEEKTEAATGIPIDTRLTQAEMALVGNGFNIDSPQLEAAVIALNQQAMAVTSQIANFKRFVRDSMIKCMIFTWSFPLLLDHIRREALMYNMSLANLQRGIDPHDPSMAAELETFWNRIMEEHSLCIRQYLDPTEKELIATANSFADRFEMLKEEAEAADHIRPAVRRVTRRSLQATTSLRDFKKQATELILMCQIKSLIAPLLADHVTREANHYLELLKHIKAHV